jgi:hypothetical protein
MYVLRNIVIVMFNDDPYVILFPNRVRFQVLTAASMKFRVFWDILPCSQIDIDVDIDLTTWQYIPEDYELFLNLSHGLGARMCNKPQV